MLGHSSAESHTIPKLVEFFKNNNLKVKDVACGEQHTVAVTGSYHLQNYLTLLIFR